MERIPSIDDPRVAAYRDLPERTRRGEGVFVAEGKLLAERLLGSRYTTESVLADESHAEDMARLAAGRAPVYVASAGLIRAIAGFPFHRGVLAAGRREEPPCVAKLVESLEPSQQASLCVLSAINQAENVGLIFRTAAALGVDGLVLGPRCCDPLSRRALRLSMGGVLRVRFARSEDLLADLELLRRRCGTTLVATVLDPGAEPLATFAWPERAAVLLGNEYAGLDPQITALCDRRVTISMQPGTDSLNVGVAAGIVLHAMVAARRRRA